MQKGIQLPRTLFFDLDGTLLDSQLGIVRCVNYALRELGHAERDESEVVEMIGPPLYKGFARLLSTEDDAMLNLAISAYRERYKDIGIFECQLYDGVREMLMLLHTAGHRMHLVTAKPERFARQLIPHFELDDLIQGIYGPTLEDTRDGKAHLIDRALAGEQAEKEGSIMIGDRDRDILGAKEVGVTSIGVTWGYGSATELDDCAPDFVVEKPADVAKVIGRLG